MTEVINGIVIYDGEDQSTLRDNYAKLMAKHKLRYTAYDVALFVFKDLPEPNRALQAADVWSKDLSVRELIDEYMLHGSEPAIDTKENRLRTLKQIYDDVATPPRDRIAAIELAAKIEGEIKKLVEAKNTNEDLTPQLPPTFIFTRYEDD